MSTSVSHLQCRCGAVYEAASLISSTKLPIETEICHCNPCRQTSGALICTYIELVRSPTTTSLAACTSYSDSQGRVERYFCSTCGTRTFDHTTKTDKWYACSGIVEPDPLQQSKGIVKAVAHKFVTDTGDGGLALPLQKIGDRDIPCYAESMEFPNTAMAHDRLAQFMHTGHAEGPKNRYERLFGSCHCGSVQFYIPPLLPSSTKSPHMQEWLSAENTKYLGLNCACRYCRLCVGFPISTNIYVMPENVVVRGDDGRERKLFNYESNQEQPIDFAASTDGLQQALPGLRFDFSSPGTRRSFCGVCGASAFFERASRPQVVNISIGILRADSGCLARDWVVVNWQKMWFKEFTTEPELVRALEMVR